MGKITKAIWSQYSFIICIKTIFVNLSLDIFLVQVVQEWSPMIFNKKYSVTLLYFKVSKYGLKFIAFSPSYPTYFDGI